MPIQVCKAFQKVCLILSFRIASDYLYCKIEINHAARMCNRVIYKRIIFIFIVFLVSGCASIGPRQINIDRNRYNDVIQETNNQQLLINIVRLRYVEPTSFLKLTNVTSSYTLNPSVNTNGTGVAYATATSPSGILTASTVTRTLNVAPAVNYLDTPTISYAPVDDSVFVNELMTPVKLESVHLLNYGGIHEARLLNRLVFQEINGLDNASAATSAKMGGALPQYKKFYQLLDNLVYLSERSAIQFRPAKVNNNYVLAIHVDNRYINTPAVRNIRKLLNIPNNGKDIILSDIVTDNAKDNVVFVKTRSIYGIMTFLSYGVQIPESDVRAKYVYTYYNPDGTRFDWTPLTQGLLKVYSSQREPVDTFIKVFVHNHWFYIKNNDLDSKSTFTLLTRLITLTAGSELGKAQSGPLLTLPAR